MIIYASWLDAIEPLPDAVQKESLFAIVKYGLRGETMQGLGTTAKAIFTLVKPQIDANNARYENGCKGGAPKRGAEPNNNQSVTKAEPNNNQSVTKAEPNNNQSVTYNDNVYDNDNENENVNDKERVSDAHPRTLTPEEEKFYQFTEWCRVYAADSLRFTEPLTLEGFWWLYRKYGADKLKQCASDLHNKSAYKRNKNALNCWKKWIENL